MRRPRGDTVIGVLMGRQSETTTLDARVPLVTEPRL